ncbi:alpha/beta fold hydrolase [Granulicella cerasi]|uniref:Alpha/beta fold hydrolase n=1 Tax=Granulicella cerasi TaxID=741063 RepID=A0ABW1Z4C4_9BACT|nr:alpha/beta hydrolase [Granulicella cerasi]
MQPTRRHLNIDGLELSFLEQGKAVPGTPSLVLLHGLMGCADTFRRLLAELSEAQHVIALDFPGAGASERREGLDATLKYTSNLTARVLEKLMIRNACVVGHSHGGAVAMTLAQTVPERVGSLVLLAPAHPHFDEGDPVIRFYISLPGRLFAYSLPWFPQWMQRIGLRRMSGQERADTLEYLQPYRENLRTPGTIRHLLSLLRTWHKDMARLQRKLSKGVTQPTLMLWGDSDRAVPHTSADELLKHFRQVKLRILPGVGHRPAEECAERVAAHITSFLARVQDERLTQSPKLAESHVRTASLMTPSFGSGD